MERVQRMKTATSPQNRTATSDRANGLRSKLKLTTLAATAALTFGFGVAAPMLASAQDAATRTMATGSGIPLAPNAPDRYTVKKGDTLWDIAKVFLRDPWFWPEIWYVNPQVKNPHLIYPGDVLALVSMDGRPQVSVAQRGPEGAAADAAAAADGTASSPQTGPMRSGGGVRISPRVRSQPITAAVTAIPYEAIAAFMRRPSLLTKEQVKTLPYVVGLRDMHLIGGQGNDVYARGLQHADVGARFNVVHIDEPLRDPENNKVMGYRGLFVGTTTVTAVGNPAKLSADKTDRELLRGDKFFPEEVAVATDFIPHPVADNVHGSIMAVEGVWIAGRYNVVAINRGTKQGIEAGHVLAISQKGEKVADHYANGGKESYWSMGHNVKLPNERAGLVMIFKAYDRMSYGLIMEATHPVRVGYLVDAP
jgi:LysM repeat protein